MNEKDLIKMLLEVVTGKTVSTEEKSNELKKYEGKNVFIKTVTLYYTGKVVSMDNKFITITNVAWIADTGKLSKMLVDKSVINECEMYPSNKLVTIAIGGIIELTEYENLPTETK